MRNIEYEGGKVYISGAQVSGWKAVAVRAWVWWMIATFLFGCVAEGAMIGSMLGRLL